MRNCDNIGVALRTGNTYRLVSPTLAIFTDRDGHRVPVTVPANAFLTIQKADSEMADVEWEDRIVRMFVIDIRTRARMVDDRERS